MSFQVSLLALDTVIGDEWHAENSDSVTIGVLGLGAARAGARAVVKVGARVVATAVARVVARVVARAGTRVVARVGARVGASSLLGLHALALATVVGVHHPEVGQHLLEEKEL